MTTSIAVAPIIIGFAFDQSISFVDGAGGVPSGFDLRTASRIFGEARAAPGNNNEVLAKFDSAGTPATLFIVNANTFRFTLSIAATWKLPPSASLWIDFAREDAGVWSLLPVQLNWPVVIPVTAPPL